MSDRMLEILSGIVFVLVVFSLFLVLVGWMEPVLKFAKGVGDAIVLIGGSMASGFGIGMRRHIRNHFLYNDDKW